MPCVAVDGILAVGRATASIERVSFWNAIGSSSKDARAVRCRTTHGAKIGSSGGNGVSLVEIFQTEGQIFLGDVLLPPLATTGDTDVRLQDTS